VRLDIAAQTDKGRRKSNNEDFYGVFREDTPSLKFFDEGALLCVADGLGGHVGGEIASKLAVSNMRDMLSHEVSENGQTDEGTFNPLPDMCTWVQRANQSVHQTNKDLVKSGKPMGTTLLAALIQPRKVFIANVGDSRCYHVREGEIIDKTEDHSWVDEQVKAGLMSKAEAEADQRKNIVTRSIGTQDAVEVDTYHWNIMPGDNILLCTDGLVNMVKDKDIAEEFKKGGTSAEIAQRLVHLANENGGKDNTTIIIANISPSLPRLVWNRSRAMFRRHGVRAAWFLITLLAFVAGAALGYYLGLIDILGLE